MKKIYVMGAALTLAFAMSSCKSNESAYKKAYEKAQAQQTVQQQTVTTTPTTTTAPVTVAPVATESNVSVRTENVTLVAGPALKAYSVVVGSFGIEANAKNLQTTLNGKGYSASVVKSPSNMFRVVASSFADKASAVSSRESLRATYPDAWLLYQK